MKYGFHEAAEREFFAAIEYYETPRPTLPEIHAAGRSAFSYTSAFSPENILSRAFSHEYSSRAALYRMFSMENISLLNRLLHVKELFVCQKLKKSRSFSN